MTKGFSPGLLKEETTVGIKEGLIELRKYHGDTSSLSSIHTPEDAIVKAKSLFLGV